MGASEVPRFSVLLPTRNGGRFLPGCIESVLAQPFGPADLELVISDNASDDDTKDVVAPYLRDPRVRHARLGSPVPVTDNWNNALAMSRGEHLLMIGDDDALMPRCLETLDAALRTHGMPECVAFNGYLYVAPGSILDNTASYYADPYHRLFDDMPPGSPLSPEKRMAIVRRMFEFVQDYPLNMQLTLFARKRALSVRGGVFQAPFPDHYGLNALLIEGRTFVTLNEKLVVIGVSPKSFGHYYFSGKHEAGMRFLGSDSSFEGRLPGNEIWSSMYRWLLLLKQNYPDVLRGIEIRHSAYQKLQLEHWLLLLRTGQIGFREALRLLALLPPGIVLRRIHRIGRVVASRTWLAARGETRRASIEDVLPRRRLDGARTISEFIRYLEARGSEIGTAPPG